MNTDVVIVGAGPNGLLMACELALAGVRPVVLERLPEPATTPKANGLVGRVVQALDYRGLYQRFARSDAPPAPAPGFQFGALPLALSTIDGHALYTLPVPQRRMEELLEERARELGVHIRRGHEVTALRQDADQVTVDVLGPAGESALTARFLVAADGGRSTVRKQCGIEFPGITDDSFVSRSGRVAIHPPVAVPGTGELDVPGIGLLRPATFTRTESGMFAYGTFQPGVYTVAVYEWGGSACEETNAMPIEELREAVGRVLGADVAIGALPDGQQPAVGRRTTGINSRQADRYRHGRVFLVGDAAHVHSGIGGPGLNLGMQDVLNLGWKLAAEVNGWAPENLLDTYHCERHPVGERVIMHTRAQTALLSPGPNITALRQLFAELLGEPRTVRHIADLMAGADVNYDMGQPAGHPLTGRWMPDLAVRTGNGPSRVAELLRPARPVLLDLADRTELVKEAGGWADRVDVVSATTTKPPADIALVRPDGYVAWAAGPDAAEAGSGLRRALSTWFGRPTAVG
jgi:2-polyprenyl-6-methoxyphenol hydroxylase-like FAD-dependent oxidoreductase